MRTVDLFAGCGGLSLGFQNAGFNLVAAFDTWRPAIEVYRANFPHPIIQADLSEPGIDTTIAALQEQMIGNAVPVKLAEYVARCICEYREDCLSGVRPSLPDLQLKLFEGADRSSPLIDHRSITNH